MNMINLNLRGMDPSSLIVTPISTIVNDSLRNDLVHRENYDGTAHYTEKGRNIDVFG